ncbi:MAG TPA: NAD(P)-dependent oxidoreductase, partial [Longimicrobiales bacterium]|nr:NAD(P)-dependent oxidoreductase [Longimicrobiales bacterium]
MLGSHLAQELRSHGHEVVALHRRSAETLVLEEAECELVQGDIRDDAEALAPLMDGCSHVAHGAALVYADGAWPKIRAVNVDGTRNILTAARLAGVKHAVHLSSVAVYGSVSGPVDENSPTDSDLPPNDLYARSKRESESAARAVAQAEGFRLTIVRPAALYGERDRLLTPRLARLVRLPILPLVGGGRNAVPIVYAGNAAHAVELILDAARGAAASRAPVQAEGAGAEARAGGFGAPGAGGAPAPRAYNVGLDHRLTQRDLLEGMARALGKSPRFVKIPDAFVRE